MPKPASPLPHARLVLIVACATSFAYGAFLLNALRRGQWITDSAGHPIVTDFLPVYAAGLLARSGHAAVAYDWRHFHDIQVSLIGHPFAGYFGWHYPPLYFLVALALTSVGYLTAYLVWVVATASGFAVVAGRIARQPAAFWAALALPPALACALVGQNGFFSAALFGAILLCLETRPVLAGLLLAALTFKPQLGVLIPFALAAGGYFRTLLVALLGTLAWIGLGIWIAPSTVAGFLHYLPLTSHAVLTDGSTGWVKLQSVYALTRLLGGSDGIGWGAQIAALLLAGGFCAWLWRQRAVPFALKAAALTAASLLSTPYLYFYDLPLIMLPLAFLARDGGFGPKERAGVAAIVSLLVCNVVLDGPFGLLAVLVVAALILGRSFIHLRDMKDLAARPDALAQTPA